MNKQDQIAALAAQMKEIESHIKKIKMNANLSAQQGDMRPMQALIQKLNQVTE